MVLVKTLVSVAVQMASIRVLAEAKDRISPMYPSTNWIGCSASTNLLGFAGSAEPTPLEQPPKKRGQTPSLTFILAMPQSIAPPNKLL